MAIAPLTPDFATRTPPTASPSARIPQKPGSSAVSFADTIEQLVADVNTAQAQAQTAGQKMAVGSVSIDEAMITMERADLQFRLLTQVRNKVVDAYREVMRMNF